MKSRLGIYRLIWHFSYNFYMPSGQISEISGPKGETVVQSNNYFSALKTLGAYILRRIRENDDRPINTCHEYCFISEQYNTVLSVIWKD